MKKAIVIIIAIKLLLIGGYILFTTNKNMKNHSGHDNNTIQSHSSFTVELTSDTANIKPNTETSISYVIKNDKGEVLKNFKVSHEKIMHFILVRKDLQHFQHLHPDFNKETGEFTTNVTFPEDGPYRLFPDFVPGKSAPVTVHTDIQVGDAANYKEIPVTAETDSTHEVDGYKVTYLLPDTQGIKSEQEITYSLVIEKDGQPVNDLENYLGAKGHSVILKANSLDYIHTHAIEEESSEGHSTHHDAAMQEAKENQINFATSFPAPGIYKIYTQFQHEGKVITSDYTVNVN